LLELEQQCNTREARGSVGVVCDVLNKLLFNDFSSFTNLVNGLARVVALLEDLKAYIESLNRQRQ
jgi:hypothetical protein